MALAKKKQQKPGWTYRENNTHNPRRDLPPRQFYAESIPSEPDSPAWDEPGYIDPDSGHENLPVGSRYWQGFVRAGAYPYGIEERPLSPGWVATVTASTPNRPLALSEPLAANWYRRVRLTERARISQDYSRIWPG